jgi:hypothetical protein
MVRHVIVWLALAACGGGANAAPRYVWHGTRWPDEGWPEPSCFAYSEARRGYACIGWTATNEGREARRGAVDLIGARGRERHVVWDGGGVGGGGVDARMRALGFRSGRIDRVELSDGGWKRVGSYGYRYQVRLHEGDASFEYSASLWLRCPDRTEIEMALRDDVLEQGERAVLFAAGGAREVALAVQGADGGEGVEVRTLDTMVLEPAAVCGAEKPWR